MMASNLSEERIWIPIYLFESIAPSLRPTFRAAFIKAFNLITLPDRIFGVSGGLKTLVHCWLEVHQARALMDEKRGHAFNACQTCEHYSAYRHTKQWWNGGTKPANPRQTRVSLFHHRSANTLFQVEYACFQVIGQGLFHRGGRQVEQWWNSQNPCQIRLSDTLFHRSTCSTRFSRTCSVYGVSSPCWRSVATNL